MGVFTQIELSFLNEKVQQYGLSFIDIDAISDGLDNSVFIIYDKYNNKFILKIYEGKNENFFYNLIDFHNRLDNITIHKILYKISNFIDGKTAIIFNKVDNNLNYNTNLILEKIPLFHEHLNDSYFLAEKLKKYINFLKDETEQFSNKILEEGYIDKYKGFIDCKNLYSIFLESYNIISKSDIVLKTGLIHNDLCKGNILPNNLNGIEFIDFDGIQKNILLKDYIILIIRFDLFGNLENYFCKSQKGIFNIGGETIQYFLIEKLYLMYSINLILNMIYYIGYNTKDVTDMNFYDNDNQTWQEIYKNLLKYKLL